MQEVYKGELLGSILVEGRMKMEDLAEGDDGLWCSLNKGLSQPHRGPWYWVGCSEMSLVGGGIYMLQEAVARVDTR